MQRVRVRQMRVSLSTRMFVMIKTERHSAEDQKQNDFFRLIGGWGKPLAGSYVPLAVKRAKYLAK